MSNILVLTGCDAGMSAVGDLTAPQIAWYARRHGYDFERVTKYAPGSHPSWQKLRLILERLPHYEVIFWVDADTVITNPAIEVEKLLGRHQGLVVSRDWTEPLPEHAAKHFSLGNFIINKCPESFGLLELASARDKWANEPLWEQQAIQEEYLENPEIRPWVKIMDRRELNAVPATPATTGPEPWARGDFLCHFTYLPNEERCRLIPGAIVEGFKALVPHLPDWHETVMCMDVRHIAMLREVCEIGWKSVLEIGTWEGASTAGFLPSLDSGKIGHYTACDVHFRDRFLDVLGPRADNPKRLVTLLEMPSSAAMNLPEDFDLIFVDGAHTAEVVAEEIEHILRRQPKCVLAHDISATAAGYGDCEGAENLHRALLEDGWSCYVDNKDRPGEMTKRGFLAATKDTGLAMKLHRIFKHYSF